MDCTIEEQQQLARLAERLFPASNYKVSFQLQSFSKEPLGFQGVHRLLTIVAREHAHPDTLKVSRFFVKTAVPNCNEDQLNLFNREPKFFGDVVPSLLDTRINACTAQPWAPKCYLAADNLLVFEDLSSQGYRVATSEFDETRLTSLFSCLARFHASSILLEESSGKSIADAHPGIFFENTFCNDGKSTWRWLTSGIEAIEAVADRLALDSRCIAKAYGMTLKAIEACDGDNEVKVLCHSDLWRNNMMFDERGENCRLVDFQLTAYKSYAVELVQALYLNATRIMRGKLERSLIRGYHAALNECLINSRNSSNYNGSPMRSMSVDEVYEAVDSKRICGLVCAAQILPIALLNKQFSSELFRDSESLKSHMYGSRKSLVLRAMQADPYYRRRIEDATTELVEHMKSISS